MSFAEPIVPKTFGGSMVAMASHGNDKDLQVEFFIEDVYQEFESAAQGRAIYKPVTKVRIFAPMAKTDIIKHVQMEDEPNSPSHPNRFPAQWRAFKAQQEQIPDGTPLEMCKFIPSHRVKELKAQGLHTAEQVAGLSDSVLQTMGMGALAMREQCRVYIKPDDSQVFAKLSATQAENDAMRVDLDMMRQQLAALNEQMSHSAGFGQMPRTQQPVFDKPKRKYTKRVQSEGVSP